MRDFLIRFVVSSAAMSIAALIFSFIFRTLRMRAKWLLLAWAIVLIGMVVPLRPHITFFSKIAQNVHAFVPGFGAEPQASSIMTTSVGRTEHIPPHLILGILWLAGTVTMLMFHLLRHRRFIRAVRRWNSNVNDNVSLETLRRVKEELGISGEVIFKRCALVPGPMLIGFFKATILIPYAFNNSLELIVRHELIHFKKKHIWLKCLAILAEAIHWYNPIQPLLSRYISDLCEMSCDEEVVKNLIQQEKQLYSNAILDAIQYQSCMRTAFSTKFNGGKNSMKRRIASILDTGKKRSGVVALSIALILILGTGVAFANGNLEDTDTTQPMSEESIDYATLSPKELAYCDLKAAPKEWKQAILDARNTIIFNHSWTVNGQGASGSADGTITPLPEFSDLFPGWDVPKIGDPKMLDLLLREVEKRGIE
jgi:beta-lactamase regulating signal transducer with metallopeptidase domain